MAYDFYVTVEGTKMGKFKGEGPKTGEKIPGLSFQYEVIAPHDSATGQHSGKRQHKPVTFVKEWGASTPQFFQALVNNEVLKTVKFEFMQINTNGEEFVFFTINLTNASVAGIRQYTETPEGVPSSKHASTAGNRELEAISFTFQKIELENKTAKTMAVDDWTH